MCMVKPARPAFFSSCSSSGVERHAVGQDHRLDALFGDEGHQLDDLRVDQRLAAGDGEIVRVAPLLEEQHFLLELFQRLVPGHVLAVTAFAVDVADIGDFEPGDGVVVHRPGQTVQVAFVAGFMLDSLSNNYTKPLGFEKP